MIKAPDFITDFSLNGWRKLNIVVVGAGGTGSALLNKLFQMHMTLTSLGAQGFSVTVFDDDVVTPSNVGRQAFWPSDVDAKKAEILVERYNRFGHVEWKAIAEKFSFDPAPYSSESLVVFGCVDNVQGRKEIHQFMQLHNCVWIDCGNDSHSSNILMGMNAKVGGKPVYLPSVYDLFKLQMDQDQTTTEPSCSTAEAISRQTLGINDMTAAYAAQILWQLIRNGEIAFHGVTLDLLSGVSTPIPCDPEIWAMFGYEDVKDVA